MSENTTPDGGFTLFETAIGRCGIAWRDGRVVAVSLPATDSKRTRARLHGTGMSETSDPPGWVAWTCERIAGLLNGADDDLADVPVDLGAAGGFDRGVYEVARSIRPGETLTYGEVAERLGDARLAREVGRALGANPVPIIVPCHRVVAADGSLGGFSAPGGRETKRRLLEIERPLAERGVTLFTV